MKMIFSSVQSPAVEGKEFRDFFFAFVEEENLVLYLKYEAVTISPSRKSFAYFSCLRLLLFHIWLCSSYTELIAVARVRKLTNSFFPIRPLPLMLYLYIHFALNLTTGRVSIASFFYSFFSTDAGLVRSFLVTVEREVCSLALEVEQKKKRVLPEKRSRHTSTNVSTRNLIHSL